MYLYPFFSSNKFLTGVPIDQLPLAIISFRIQRKTLISKTSHQNNHNHFAIQTHQKKTAKSSLLPSKSSDKMDTSIKINEATKLILTFPTQNHQNKWSKSQAFFLTNPSVKTPRPTAILSCSTNASAWDLSKNGV